MISPRSLAMAALTATFIIAAGSARGVQDDLAKTSEQAAKKQRVEGVVIRVEPIGENKTAARGVKLTINTAAVWRDYVRDTATTKEPPPEKAARKGKESVATKGQPVSPGTVTTVEVTPDSRLELRYRTAMDERTQGAASADAARKLTSKADDPSQSSKESVETAGKTIKVDQIKPGLFVHVRYHRDGKQDRADRLIVLEPIRDEVGK
jgi:hypothetical protein